MAGPYSVSGTGTQTIAQPSALVVATVGRIATSRSGRANPPNWYDVALLTPGDTNGWYTPVAVTGDPFVMLLPPGCNRLGYAVLGATSLTLTEVPAPNYQKQPWDRNPALFSQGGPTFVNGATALTTLFSYTVPTGRIARVVRLRAQIVRQITPTSASYVQANLRINTATVSAAVLPAQAENIQAWDDLGGGPLDLPAGSVIDGQYVNNDTGGQVLISLIANGYLFDA